MMQFHASNRRLSPAPALLLGCALLVGCDNGSGGDAQARGLPAEPAATATTQPTARRICDGSPGLTLGYRASGGLPPLGDIGRLLAEAGYDVLYVDGSCRYWAHAGFGPLAWRGVVTGRLTEADEAALAKDVRWDSLPERYGTVGKPDTEDGRLVLFDAVGTSECLGLCDGVQATTWRDASVGAHDWVERLYARGEPADLSIRLRAAELQDGAGGTLYPLSLSIPLAAIAAGTAPPAPAFLVSDAGDLAALRAMRRELLGEGVAGSLVVESEGKRFRLAFRDAFPFEGADGVVAAPTAK